jgi:hypothetical protein
LTTTLYPSDTSEEAQILWAYFLNPDPALAAYLDWLDEHDRPYDSFRLRVHLTLGKGRGTYLRLELDDTDTPGTWRRVQIAEHLGASYCDEYGVTAYQYLPGLRLWRKVTVKAAGVRSLIDTGLRGRAYNAEDANDPEWLRAREAEAAAVYATLDASSTESTDPLPPAWVDRLMADAVLAALRDNLGGQPRYFGEVPAIGGEGGYVPTARQDRALSVVAFIHHVDEARKVMGLPPRPRDRVEDYAEAPNG